MIEKKFILGAEEGLHARPASILAKEAMKFLCDIKLYKSGLTSKAYQPKSILSLMSCGAAKGDELTFTTEGSDEVAAMAKISQLFATNFEG